MFIQSLLHYLALLGLAFFTWTQTFFGGAVVHIYTPTPVVSVEPPVHITTGSTTTSPLPQKKSQPIQQTKGATTIPKITVAPPSIPAPITTAQNLAVNEEARSALVNILCTTLGGGYLHPISGSGVIIDSRGVILTNAHVGQYFLLQNYPVPNNVTCTIRTGSPAQATYTATLLYLPPIWIAHNAAQIISAEPTGTGENDYSFLLITGMTNNTSLPASFPNLPYSLSTPTIGEPVLLAAYPAGFIEGETIEMNLYAASALSTVQTLYSFNENMVDDISVGGSVVAQAGSSGGAVVSTENGKLIGIIATEMTASTTAQRDLHAVTTDYINRDLQVSGLGGITTLLSGDLGVLANTFSTEVAPLEKQKLIQVLQHQ